jgi:hypothetical protein
MPVDWPVMCGIMRFLMERWTTSRNTRNPPDNLYTVWSIESNSDKPYGPPKARSQCLDAIRSWNRFLPSLLPTPAPP